jgi:hypothetical protein
MLKRKSPRIISRSKKAKAPSPGDIPPKPIPKRNDEIDEELRSEIVVKGGVVMRVERAHFLDNGTRAGPSIPHHITTNGQVALPGIAEEVESYPCPFCSDRVFLTTYGLEKHAAECHADHLDAVSERINKISEEWSRRRAVEVKRVTNHTFRNVDFTPKSVVPVYQRSALHLKAHEKNDELRQRLLRDYGPGIVAKLTCRDCSLVFTDEEKLQAHYLAVHPRRRKYLCKWCGQICLTVTELNAHKYELHGIPSSSGLSYYETNGQHQLSDRRRFEAQERLVTARANVPAYTATPGPSNELVDTETLVQTNCNACGLLIVRPSLLVRHMVRAHNQHDFTAILRSHEELPPINGWCRESLHHPHHCIREVLMFSETASSSRGSVLWQDFAVAV